MIATERSMPHAVSSSTLADVLERVLDKGVVIAGDIKVKLVDIELLTIQIRLLIASVDKAREIGMDWWLLNPDFTSKPAVAAPVAGAAPDERAAAAASRGAGWRPGPSKQRIPPHARERVADGHTTPRGGRSPAFPRRALLLLRAEPRIEVVGQAASGREAVELACELRPDVIHGHRPPGPERHRGRANLRRVPARPDRLRHRLRDAPYVARAVEAGAAGYVLKDSPSTRSSRRSSSRPRRDLSHPTWRRLMEVCRNPEYGHGPAELGGLRRGNAKSCNWWPRARPPSRSPRTLHVSAKTVETHRQMVMDKLGLHSVAGLTKFAIRPA